MNTKKFLICWITNWNVLPITKHWEVVNGENNTNEKIDNLVKDGVSIEDIKVAEYFGE